MQQLQATTAREIDKASITEAETLAVNGSIVKAAEGGMQPGDFYLRPNVVSNGIAIARRWNIFARDKGKLKTEILYTVVMSCPVCGMALITSTDNAVLSKRPLTLAKQVGCPYGQAGDRHAFTIKAGIIEPA